MNEAEYNLLRETTWRRSLTAAEMERVNAWLATHPEAASEWEEEAALSGMMERLPKAPVSSNFTAQVMGAIARDCAAASPRRPRWNLAEALHHWLPRMALASMVVSLAALVFYQQRQGSRAEYAASLGTFSKVAVCTGQDKLLGIEVFQDFDTIRALPPGNSPVDMDLLAAMQ